MSGLDVKGVTDNFKVMPKVFDEENVVSLKKAKFWGGQGLLIFIMMEVYD